MRNHTAAADTHLAPAHHGRVRWGAAAAAGLIGGAVFMMAEMLMVWIFMGQSPWGPPRMIAAMVMGTEVLPPPATFAMVPVMVAMMIHFALSIALGLVLGAIIGHMSKGAALMVGAVFGVVVYLVNFHLIAPMMFPWFVEAQNWVSIVAHVLFGAVTAGAYVAMRDRHA